MWTLKSHFGLQETCLRSENFVGVNAFCPKTTRDTSVVKHVGLTSQCIMGVVGHLSKIMSESTYYKICALVE